ncbi:MAG: tRNA pseudouridine(38-40) synthase TruA [Nocardioidaceae bacterium]
MRLRIDLAYDGAGFRGWARQPGLRTVEGELERALALVLRVDEVGLTCAGRTDTGVHARGQVAHVDVPDEALLAADSRSTPSAVESLPRRLNGVLSEDIRVRGVEEAPPGFDARFSARWRRYAYRLADSTEVVDPLTRGQVLAWPHPLELAAMSAAGAALLGEHDFAAFCRRREGATTVRTLLEVSWSRVDGVAVGTVRADAFCHNMVRSLVGCLVAVGEGRRPIDWPGRVLGAGVRDPAVQVVAPKGLTLEEVSYPPDDELALVAERRRAVRTLTGDGP